MNVLCLPGCGTSESLLFTQVAMIRMEELEQDQMMRATRIKMLNCLIFAMGKVYLAKIKKIPKKGLLLGTYFPFNGELPFRFAAV